jgi:hypothetical protein
VLFRSNRPFEHLLAKTAFSGILGKKNQPYAIFSLVRQIDTLHMLFKEIVRYLYEDPRTVTGLGVSAYCPAV